MAEPITPEHPRWNEFALRLEGPEGCDFTEEDGKVDSVTWRCRGGYDKTYSKMILAAMGFPPDVIAASLLYYEEHGGHCDCEVLFNVDRRPPAA